MDNNIHFFTNELNSEDNDNENIDNIFEEILKNNNIISNTSWNNDLDYYKQFTTKELLKICNYYGIDKNIKGTRYKKQDIISLIIFFENIPENFEIVFQRNKMWNYINELIMDQKMKQYILWN